MGRINHNDFINSLRSSFSEKEKTSEEIQINTVSLGCFDEDDALFREELEKKWQELFGDTSADEDNNE